MAFTSAKYLIFLVLVVVAYYLINPKFRKYLLLISSYYFYMCWNAKYALLMLFSTIITYISGILISKTDSRTKKKIYLILSFIINLGILILFKYYSFIVENLNEFFKMNIPETLNLLLPVGISFYTFQALSYSFDVYRKDIEPEKDFFKYALFVSFFPQLVAGPIEKSKDLVPQFKNEKKFEIDNIYKGSLLILSGFIYKLVISDRAAIYVNLVYNNVGAYQNVAGNAYIYAIATILFAIQIYFDFNAYSTIARGSAKILGYNLTINFKLPYLATSIKDFWRRWHISLSSWFKEYLYFPLGGSRVGIIKNLRNIMIVFLVSGLWHGAAWTFIIWGFLHGIYQVIETLLSKYSKIHINFKPLKILITFALVCFAWIFFRANNVGDAFLIIRGLFDNFHLNRGILLDISLIEYIILGVYLIVIGIFEILSTKVDLFEKIKKKNIIIRYTIYYILIFSSIIFGIYGPGFSMQEFIYFQF